MNDAEKRAKSVNLSIQRIKNLGKGALYASGTAFSLLISDTTEGIPRYFFGATALLSSVYSTRSYLDAYYAKADIALINSQIELKPLGHRPEDLQNESPELTDPEDEN